MKYQTELHMYCLSILKLKLKTKLKDFQQKFYKHFKTHVWNFWNINLSEAIVITHTETHIM